MTKISRTPEELYQSQLRASKKWKDNNREYTRKYSREKYQRLASSKEGYAQLFLKRSKSYTRDTDINLEFLLGFPDFCNITKKPFVYINNYNTVSNPLAPSIDRIDSNRGYYKDNVQIIFNCINKMKSDIPNSDFIELWKGLTID